MAEEKDIPYLKIWANDKNRREWLKSYHDWQHFASVEEMGLEFFAYEFPDKSIIYAVEYGTRAYDHEVRKTVPCRKAYYYIRKPDEFFRFEACLESLCAAHIMAIKQKILAGLL